MFKITSSKLVGRNIARHERLGIELGISHFEKMFSVVHLFLLFCS